jgi:hypothetical protein
MQTADDTDELDEWITVVHYLDDPWIIAAAQAGDGRAMRMVAGRVHYRPSAGYVRLERAAQSDPAARQALPDWPSLHRRIEERQASEETRWLTASARHGDPEALAELDEYRRADHSSQHFLRELYSEAGPAPGITTPEDDPEACRAGAAEGYASCMLRWAAHLRTLGPGHQAEADRWEAEAEHGKPDEVPRRGGSIEAKVDPDTIVLTAVATATVVPFVQAMMAKAGQDSYDGLRRWLLETFRGVLPPRHKPDRKGQVLLVSPPPGEPPAAVLQVWTDLPDEAIAALSQLLYDLRRTQRAQAAERHRRWSPRRRSVAPAQPAEQRWYWNGGTRRWELLQLPPDQADQGNATSSPPG